MFMCCFWGPAAAPDSRRSTRPRRLLHSLLPRAVLLPWGEKTSVYIPTDGYMCISNMHTVYIIYTFSLHNMWCNMYTYLYVDMCINICICMHVCVCVHMYIYIYVDICIACIYIYIYILCVYIYTLYIFTYTYTHTSSPKVSGVFSTCSPGVRAPTVDSFLFSLVLQRAQSFMFLESLHRTFCLDFQVGAVCASGCVTCEVHGLGFVVWPLGKS